MNIREEFMQAVYELRLCLEEQGFKDDPRLVQGIVDMDGLKVAVVKRACDECSIPPSDFEIILHPDYLDELNKI